jgi:hypothetical protein
MSYTDEKQLYQAKNKFIVKVMVMYLEDYECLYECLDIDTRNVVIDVEDLIIHLIDLQGDCIYYTPLTVA